MAYTTPARGVSSSPLIGGVSTTFVPTNSSDTFLTGGAVRAQAPAAIVSPTQTVDPVQNVNPVMNTSVENAPVYNQPFNYTNNVTQNTSIASPFSGFSSIGDLNGDPDIPAMRFAALTGQPAPPLVGKLQHISAPMMQQGGAQTTNFTPQFQPLQAFAMGGSGQILPAQMSHPYVVQQPQMDKDGGLQAGEPQADMPPVAPDRNAPQSAPQAAPQRPVAIPQAAPSPQPVSPGMVPQGGPWQQAAAASATPGQGPAYPTTPDFRGYLPPAQHPTFLNRLGNALVSMSPNASAMRAAQAKGDLALREKMYEIDSQNFRQLHGDAHDIDKERMTTIRDMAKEEMKNDTELKKADLTAKAQGKMTQQQGWQLFKDAMEMDTSTRDGLMAQAQRLQAASQATGMDLMSHLGKRDTDATKLADKKALEAAKDVVSLRQQVFDLTQKSPRDVNAMDRTAALQNNEIGMLPVKNATARAGMQSALSQAAVDTNPQVMAARINQAVNAGTHSGQQVNETAMDMDRKQQEAAYKPIDIGLRAIEAAQYADPATKQKLMQLGTAMLQQGQQGYDTVRRAQQVPGANQRFVAPPPPLVPALDGNGNPIPDKFLVSGKQVNQAQALEAQAATVTGIPKGSLLPSTQFVNNADTEPNLYDQFAQTVTPMFNQFSQWIQGRPPQSLAPVATQARDSRGNLVPDTYMVNGRPMTSAQLYKQFGDGLNARPQTVVPPMPPAQKGTPLQDLAIRDAYLAAAGGDKAKAKKLAERDGWTIPKIPAAALQRYSQDDGTMGMLAPLYMDATTGAKGQQVFANIMQGLGR
ncbi:MAG TPA: hypothetical protein V6C76_12695 [Drouetiella sp.]